MENRDTRAPAGMLVCSGTVVQQLMRSLRRWTPRRGAGRNNVGASFHSAFTQARMIGGNAND